MNDNTTETTKTAESTEVFAIVAYTGIGRATRRRILSYPWHVSSPRARDFCYGAEMAYRLNGRCATVCAYVRDTRDGSDAYWTLCHVINDNSRRSVSSHLTADLSDTFYPDLGKSAREICHMDDEQLVALVTA